MSSSSAPVDRTREVIWMTKSRLEAFVDAVFAIAMTLLVLGISDPILPHEATSPKILSALIGMRVEFLHYVVAFLILAAFLLAHHKQFARIKKMDINLFWLNILMLLFVCLVPFSTALSGDYHSTQIAVVLFHMNLLVIGLLYLAHWWYASHGHRLVDASLPPSVIRALCFMALIIPLVAFLAILVSYISPSASMYMYLAILPLKMGVSRVFTP